MPKGHSTSLFISSTCYDLSQVRADLADFARTIGYEPIMSEIDSFPVDPSSTTVANCLEVVRTRADLFLLIVGARYGSIADTGKSVTNLEYLEASARAIPRYVFVKRDILALLPIWKANPQADFTATVDTPKLLEFVSALRGSGDLWVFPFDTAQDITQTLTKQISYLMADCLELRSRLRNQDHTLLSLGPETLRVYLEKPNAWEYKAFAKAIVECMRRHKSTKLDYELGLNFDQPIKIEDAAAVIEWVNTKVGQMAHIVDKLSSAVNGGIQVAVGRLGEPGDIARIWHLAERTADAYAALLHWALEFDRVATSPDLQTVVALARRLIGEPLNQIEDFAEHLFENVVAALQRPSAERTITLSLTVGDTAELLTAMRQLYDQ